MEEKTMGGTAMKKRTHKLCTILVLLLIMCMSLGFTSNAAVKISKKSIFLMKGESCKLKVTGTKKKVKWSSSNKNVATVSSNGKVTAKKEGLVTITAKISNKKYKCKVEVVQGRLEVGIDTSYGCLDLSVRNTSNYSVTVENALVASGSYVDNTTLLADEPVTLKPGKSALLIYEANAAYLQNYRDASLFYDCITRVKFNFKYRNKIIPFKLVYSCEMEDNLEYGYEYDWILYQDGKRISPKFNDPDMSYKEFTKIKKGMTYKKVVSIVGGNGILRSSSKKIKTYEWDSEESTYGWAMVTFKNGKVYRKTQYL